MVSACSRSRQARGRTRSQRHRQHPLIPDGQWRLTSVGSVFAPHPDVRLPPKAAIQPLVHLRHPTCRRVGRIFQRRSPRRPNEAENRRSALGHGLGGYHGDGGYHIGGGYHGTGRYGHRYGHGGGYHGDGGA